MAERTPRNRLSNMDVVEISTVPAGDNPDALVTFWKSKGDNCGTCGDSLTDSGRCDSCDPVNKTRNPTRGRHTNSIGDMPTSRNQPSTGVEDEMGEDEVLDAVLEQNALLAKMLGAVVGVDPETDPDGFISAFQSITKASDEDDEDDDDEEDDEDDDDVAKTGPFDDEYLDDDDLYEDDDEFDPEDLVKSDPRLAALIASYQDEIAKSQNLAEQAARVALGEREARMDVRFNKAAEALEDLGEDTEDMVDLLKSLYLVCDSDLYARVESTLAKAAHTVRTAEESSGAFEETGYGANTRAIAKTAASGPSLEELMAQLDDGSITKAAGAEPMTREAAFLKSLEANPAAYDNAEFDRIAARINGGR